MLEIFIPTKIKWFWEINFVSEIFLEVLEKSFSDVKIESFDSSFFEWIYLESKNIDENLIILLNWEFWEYYFLDYDFFDKKVVYSWIRILKNDDINKNIEKIVTNFWSVVSELKSNKLLTNTKKEKIFDKINSSFFTLSQIVFVLHRLRDKSENNNVILENENMEVEYRWQASLLKETSKTKIVELTAGIDVIEWRVKVFIDTISKLI